MLLSENFTITPFDLHVLGTPPAFILSQDQTLMLKNNDLESELIIEAPLRGSSVMLHSSKTSKFNSVTDKR